MRKLIIVALAIVSVLSSCSSKQEKKSEKAILSGVIENSDITNMMLVNMDRTEQDTVLINEDGTFRVEVDADEYHLFTLFYKQDILELYLMPGENLEVVSDGTAFMANPQFKGSMAEEAKVMNKKLTLTTGVRPQELIVLKPEAFLAKMNSTDKEVNDLIDNSNINNDLKRLLKTDAFFTLLPLREGYANRKADKIAEIDTAAFFAYRPRVEKELANAENLESTAFKMYLFNYLQNGLMTDYQEEMREAGDRWVIVMLESVPNIIKEAAVRDYCYNMLYRNMMMGRMVQMPEEIVPDVVSTYKRLVENPEFEKDIDTEYEAYQMFKEEANKAKLDESK